MFNHCMVDVETTGVDSGRNAMIQLAAVRFNLDPFEIDHNFFVRSLSIPPWRFWSEDTWDWWSRQKEGVLNDIISKMEDPGTVMKDFYEWSLQQDGPVPVWWSKPSHFDFQFVSSYLKDYGLRMPYNYWTANDMRSFMRGRAYPREMKEPDVDFVGDAHNALADVLHQITVLATFLEENGDE